jgi:hypothetical protein
VITRGYSSIITGYYRTIPEARGIQMQMGRHYITGNKKRKNNYDYSATFKQKL